MKYVVRVDIDRYIISLDTYPEESAVEVPDEVVISKRKNCWKYENNKFTLDEEKYSDLEKKSIANAEISYLKQQLSSADSPYGDWKNLKQLDTGEYTEEEMAEYRAKRQEMRERINELESQI